MKNRIINCGKYSILEVTRKGQLIEVIIDTDDVDKISSVGSWHAIKDNTLRVPSYYIAHRYNSKTKGKGVIKLHRLICDCPRDKEVDHINHDTLDNRKCNLRVCSHFENQQNLRSRTGKRTGVFLKANGKWVANITKDKKRYCKEFKSEEQAVEYRLYLERTLYRKEVINGSAD